MPKLRSEIRKSYLFDKYVIITPSRAKRPRDIEEETLVRRTGECPFCPSNISKKVIKDQINGKGGKWEIISIPNIYPAVTLDNRKAFGTQEVVVDMRSHEKDLATASKAHIKNVLKMYAKRTKVLTRNKKLDYILCFKNQGSKAGASIIHSHSQIFATEIVPRDLREEAKLSAEYKFKNKTCAYCDIIKKESGSKREIYSDKYVQAFTPYASEYHYEAWIFTKRHIDNITLINDRELSAMAQALKIILRKLRTINLPFNYFLHNVISDTNQHFYIKVQPRDSIWAGIELGSGLVINSVRPEDAATFYRS